MNERRIPAGMHPARAVYDLKSDPPSPEFGTTAKGYDQIAFDIELLDIEGERVTTYLTFSDKSRQFSLDRLRVAGWDGVSQDLKGIGSTEFEVNVKYETYEGKERMKIDIVSGGMGRQAMKNQMADTQKRSFMAGLIEEAKKSPTPQPGAGFEFGANAPAQAAGNGRVKF